MSMKLDHDAIYILPDAFRGGYAILRATEEADGWHLREYHGLDGVAQPMEERASLPAEQQLHYQVGTEGELIEQSANRLEHATAFTITNLNLLGRLRDGVLVQPNEGL
jgi:hypothetical protein